MMPGHHSIRAPGAVMRGSGPTWVLRLYAVMALLMFVLGAPLGLVVGVLILAGSVPVPAWLAWVPPTYLYVVLYALPLTIGLCLVLLHAHRYRYERQQGWIEPGSRD